jgi:serine/threonine protein kinase
MLWTPGECLKTRPYRIDAILEIGGFSIAYQATHLELNHQVVIKTINDTLQSDPEYSKTVKSTKNQGLYILQNFGQLQRIYQRNFAYHLHLDLVKLP